MCLRGGREFISNQYFHVDVPQPIGFCIFKKRAIRVQVHFPVLNASLPAETFPGKMQLPFFSLFAVVMPKWKADENRALGHQKKDSETHTTDFQKGISDKYYVKSSSGVHRNSVM